MGGSHSKDEPAPPMREEHDILPRKVCCLCKPVDRPEAKKEPMPLQGSHLQVEINDMSAELTLIQHYVNQTEVTMEVSLVVPTGGADSGVVICGLEADMGGRRLVGEAREKEEAADMFEDALASGGSAMLMEQRDEHTSVLSIGRLDPHEHATVKLVLAASGKAFPDSGRIQHSLPRAFFALHDKVGEAALKQEEGTGDVQSAVGATPASGVRIALHGRFAAPVLDVQAPGFVLELDKGGDAGGESEFTARVVSADGALGSMDVEILLSGFPFPACSVECDARAADSSKYGVAAVAIAPELHPMVQEKSKNDDINTEYIFVLDCSGSMRGQRIQESIRAMKLFLTSMSEGVFFNIICFGSKFVHMWPESRRFEDATADESLDYVGRLDANLGGTQLLPVLDSIFSSQPLEGKTRQIFVLTDGQVSNREECIASAANARGSTRVFTVGIGGADPVLVKELARAGNGRSDLVELGGSGLSSVVVSQLKAAQVVALTDCSLEVPPFASCAQQTIPPFFSSDTRNLFVFFPDGLEAPFEVIFRAKCDAEVLEERIVVDPRHMVPGTMLHNLGVRQRIEEIERGCNNRDPNPQERAELLELSKLFHQVCKITSFIIVDEASRAPLEATPQKAELDGRLQQHLAKSAAPLGSSKGYAGGMFRSSAKKKRTPADKQLMCSAIERQAVVMRPVQEECRASSMMMSEGMADMPAPPPPPPAAPAPRPTAAPGGGGASRKRADAPRASSSSSSSSNMPSGSSSPLDALLFSQRVSGAFSNAELLCAASAGTLSPDSIRDSCPQGMAEEVWITALVVALLESRHADRQGDWELIVNKARRYLSKHLGGEASSVDDALASAGKLLTGKQ